MKLLRLGMQFLRPILEDKSMNAFILLLVRDPRAIMISRMTTVNFCYTNDCYDPNILCSNMENDLVAYLEYSNLFPGRVILLRYEDLSLYPFEILEKVFKTTDLDFHSRIKEYVLTHSKIVNISTGEIYWDSRTHLLEWTNTINATFLRKVQIACYSVMQKLGYKIILSNTNVSLTDILEEMKLKV